MTLLAMILGVVAFIAWCMHTAGEDDGEETGDSLP